MSSSIRQPSGNDIVIQIWALDALNGDLCAAALLNVFFQKHDELLAAGEEYNNPGPNEFWEILELQRRLSGVFATPEIERSLGLLATSGFIWLERYPPRLESGYKAWLIGVNERFINQYIETNHGG